MRIAISGLSGCGNTTISNMVAEKLGLKRFNYTNRDLAKEKNISFQEMLKRVEESDAIDLELDRKLALHAIEHDNIVIASRLAIWLDDERLLEKVGLQEKPAFDLKAWLDAPLEERAKRIAQREGKAFEQAKKETLKRDEANWRRYKKIYGINVNEYGLAFQVDAAKNSAEQVAEIIASKAKQLTR